MKDKFDKAIIKLTFIKLGRQIKLNRKNRGLTITQLARLVNITPQRLKSIEEGQSPDLNVDTLLLIANTFDCTLNIKFVETLDQVRELHKEPNIIATFQEEKNQCQI